MIGKIANRKHAPAPDGVAARAFLYQSEKGLQISVKWCTMVHNTMASRSGKDTIIVSLFDIVQGGIGMIC